MISKDTLAIRSTCIDRNQTLKHERRTGKPPLWNLCLRIRCNVGPPVELSGGRIQTVEPSVCTHRINTSFMKRRSGSRSRTGDDFFESRRVPMRPDLFAVFRVITNYEFVFATLFLSEQSIANHGKRRPAWTNPMPPQFAWWCFIPVASNANAVQLSISRWTAKA